MLPVYLSLITSLSHFLLPRYPASILRPCPFPSLIVSLYVPLSACPSLITSLNLLLGLPPLVLPIHPPRILRTCQNRLNLECLFLCPNRLTWAAVPVIYSFFILFILVTPIKKVQVGILRRFRFPRQFYPKAKEDINRVWMSVSVGSWRKRIIKQRGGAWN